MCFTSVPVAWPTTWASHWPPGMNRRCGSRVTWQPTHGGKPQASLLGGGRTSLVQAATVNGIASHVLDFDDTHEPTILHGTGPVMSAALAAAELVNASGAALLAAHAIGFEVAARVALAVNPEHYDQGFHVTGTCRHLAPRQRPAACSG